MPLWKKYLLFLLKSTNQHGVHSPFVFRLVTQCFYLRDKIPCSHYPEGISKRKGQFLLRLVKYFAPKSIKIYSDRKDFTSFFPAPLTEVSKQQQDMIILYQQENKPTIEQLIEQMHNDSLLLVVAPHQRENEDFFKQLAENKAFTVVIDTFSFALFFIRSEQERECFVIRT